MRILDDFLQVEVNGDRYDTHVGFHSLVINTQPFYLIVKLNACVFCRSDRKVVTAMQFQLNFIKNIFVPLVTKMPGIDLMVSDSYFGAAFGQNHAHEFKQFKPINKPDTIETKFHLALSSKM